MYVFPRDEEEAGKSLKRIKSVKIFWQHQQQERSTIFVACLTKRAGGGQVGVVVARGDLANPFFEFLVSSFILFIHVVENLGKFLKFR
jgi:hypothetical protein